MPAVDQQSDALARVYAKSLFDLADADGGSDRIEEVSSELQQIIELTLENRTFGEFLRSEILAASDRAKSLHAIFDGRVTDLTLRFLLVLNEKDRLGRIQSIAAAFDELVQERLGRIEVDVMTASPVEKDQLDRITESLRSQLGREPVVHTYVEPEMVGGLKLRVGDQLIDGSISTQLRNLKRQLATEGLAEIRARSNKLLD